MFIGVLDNMFYEVFQRDRRKCIVLTDLITCLSFFVRFYVWVGLGECKLYFA